YFLYKIWQKETAIPLVVLPEQEGKAFLVPLHGNRLPHNGEACSRVTEQEKPSPPVPAIPPQVLPFLFAKFYTGTMLTLFRH
ncbi:MAG: hypothetical protein IKM36_05665, partial [Oscillospiraceae bacterium]|nr:hypothetical protein [Oscillospiraceae bacterium]